MEALDKAIQELIDGNQSGGWLPFGVVKRHLLAIKKALKGCVLARRCDDCDRLYDAKYMVCNECGGR